MATRPTDSDMAAAAVAAHIRLTRGRTVYLAGDSIVAASPGHELPVSGWGPHLTAPLNHALGRSGLPMATVVNGARGGATTDSLRQDGIWAALMLLVRAGDMVVVQLGHNDAKDPRLLAEGRFQDNLRRMIKDVRARRAYPVLCTPMAIRPDEDGTVSSWPDVEPHRRAVREVAEKQGVPLIDLGLAGDTLLDSAGPGRCRESFAHVEAGHPLWPDGLTDDVHLSIAGARFAGLVVALKLEALLGAVALDGLHPET